MSEQDKAIKQIQQIALNNSDIEVLWLYGSRARNLAHKNSDYDLAIAFKDYIEDPVERRLRPELLALAWTKKLGLALSILDIDQAPLLMAYTIVEDNCTLHITNNYRKMVTEQRIMSKWELDYLYHRKQYA